LKLIHKYIFLLLLLNAGLSLKSQNTTLGNDSTVFQSRFVDFFFFDGSYNIVAFRINESAESVQLMLSSADSSTYCFNVSPAQFKVLIGYMEDFRLQLEQQPNWPIKCKYCQTLQMFWFDGSTERSTLKRSFYIPDSFNIILDFCYEISSNKKRCSTDIENFKSFHGFEDYIKGPSSMKE
jgi:hypothetical protein